MARLVYGFLSVLAKGRQLGLYAVFGFANTASDLILFLVFVDGFKFPAVLGTGLSIVLASIQSYFLNGLFTFGVSKEGLLSASRALSFLLVCIVSVALAMTIVFYMQGAIGVIPAKLVSILVNLAFGFWLNKTLVFSLRSKNERR